MEENEFRRILELFPVVRSRDYHGESERPRESSSQPVPYEIDSWQDAWNEDDKEASVITEAGNEDPFWRKLRVTAERKMSPSEADRFTKAFQKVHKKLVYEDLSLDGALKYIQSTSQR